MYNSEHEKNFSIKDYMVVIQAGGKGTRMAELTKDMIPKPMLILNGKPMIQWQIENIRKYGITNFVVIIGYLGEKIQAYFGDGSEYGVDIQYIVEKEPLGSAGALYFLKDKFIHKNFILIYGDVMFDIDWNRVIAFHEKKKGLVSLLMHPNTHPWDSDIVIADEKQCVTRIDYKKNRKEQVYDNCVNAGLYILSAAVLKEMQTAERIDLEMDLLQPLIEKKQVFGYKTAEYVKDAGTVSRFYSVCEEQKSGIWKRRNLENRQKCIFVNGNVLFRKDDAELNEEAIGAFRLLNTSDYLVVVYLEKLMKLENTYKKLQVCMGEQGVYADDIVSDMFLIEMLMRVSEKYNLELSDSYFIGNSQEDVRTLLKTRMKIIYCIDGLKSFYNGDDEYPDYFVKDFLEAVKMILELPIVNI